VSAADATQGHWTVENGNGNHLSRDASLPEEKSQIRSWHGLANNEALHNLVLTMINRNGKFATVSEGMAHYTSNREATLEALLARKYGSAAQAAGQPHGSGSGPVGKGNFRL